MKLFKQALTLLVCWLFVLFPAQGESFGFIGQSEDQSSSSAKLSPQELQQLVAPIALYPDALVGQILAASTYPAEIVEADRWLQSHPELKGKNLAKEVDKQHWDSSVKALTQFPSVLSNLDKNLPWTSSLGDAYANQEQDVTNAVQGLRHQARKAGHLDTNQQESVSTQGNTIVIQPANPNVVYVPAFDPWVVYGGPIVAYPGWVPVPGIFFGGPAISFGVGFGIGFFADFGWGWGHWGCDWAGHRVIYNHSTYISHSRTIINRNRTSASRGHGGFDHGNTFHNTRSSSRGNGFTDHANRASTAHSARHSQSGMHSGAFSGFDHGGNVHGFSSRGRASFGGGFHGGRR